MKKNKKRASGTQNPARDPGTQKTPNARRWRLLLILLFCLVGAAVSSFVVFEYLVAKIPTELIGTWQVTKGNLRGATLEFRRNGTAVATRHRDGQKEIDTYTVAVQGKKLILTTKDQSTGKEETFTQTIITLTEDNLVLRDENENSYYMTRMRN